MITSMNTRLKQFLSAENITQAQFADSLDVVRASVSHVLSGRNNPSYDFIKAIMLHYPHLNIEWLIFGKGKMYKGQENNSLFAEADDNAVVQAPDGSASAEVGPVVCENPPSSADDTEFPSVPVASGGRKVSKIVVLFDDGSYQVL